MAALLIIISIAAYVRLVHPIPPSQCFANFRSDDCGKTPTPVMYYWKPGSRCEVGIWRGCLPNINMFKDEYECVTTCIFAVRSQEQDWHKINEGEEAEENTERIDDDFSNTTTASQNTTSANETQADTNTTDTDDYSTDTTEDTTSENIDTDTSETDSESNVTSDTEESTAEESNEESTEEEAATEESQVEE